MREFIIGYLVVTYVLGIILALTNPNPHASPWYALVATLLSPITVPWWITEFIIVNLKR